MIEKLNIESKIIIVSGPPGSGKSTMSKDYVASKSRVEHISAGELVRKIRLGDVKSSHTQIVEEALQKRIMMPDETFAKIILEKILNAGDKVDLSLLDGFPQQNGDWEHFNDLIKKSGLQIIGAICLTAKEETCVERMKFRGMRNGEEVRNHHTDLEEYYRERYRKYMTKLEQLKQMLVSKNVRTEVFDANSNIMNQEIRREVGYKFNRSINRLIEKTNYF